MPVVADNELLARFIVYSDEKRPDGTVKHKLFLKLDELSEREVVILAMQDPLAISYLYRQHYGAIHRYVNRRIGNADDTNDIVAEVFMSMVRYLPRFRCCWSLERGL